MQKWMSYNRSTAFGKTNLIILPVPKTERNGKYIKTVRSFSIAYILIDI
jgi:hypothetical protein